MTTTPSAQVSALRTAVAAKVAFMDAMAALEVALRPGVDLAAADGVAVDEEVTNLAYGTLAGGTVESITSADVDRVLARIT